MLNKKKNYSKLKTKKIIDVPFSPGLPGLEGPGGPII